MINILSECLVCIKCRLGKVGLPVNTIIYTFRLCGSARYFLPAPVFTAQDFLHEIKIMQYISSESSIRSSKLIIIIIINVEMRQTISDIVTNCVFSHRQCYQIPPDKSECLRIRKL